MGMVHTGKITVLEDNSAKWEISDLSFSTHDKSTLDMKTSYYSDSFTLAIGECHFLIERDHFNFTLSLVVWQTRTFQSILLSIQKSQEVLQSQVFHNNESPSMQIRNPKLIIGTEIIIHCVVEMEAFGAELAPNKDNVVHDEKVLTHKDKGTTKFIKDHEEILRSGKYSDAVLNVQGKEFKVHRVIVGMRSPVFSAMFENEMEEKNSGVVNIEDCDPETFPDFLHYIYTGAVEDLTSKNAFQLYAAADKYQLQELKEECLEYMKGNVSVENFCDVMSLSLLHQEEELTRIATQFFLENAADVVPTAKWMTFLTENVIAGNELMIKLTKYVAKRNK